MLFDFLGTLSSIFLLSSDLSDNELQIASWRIFHNLNVERM